MKKNKFISLLGILILTGCGQNNNSSSSGLSVSTNASSVSSNSVLTSSSTSSNSTGSSISSSSSSLSSSSSTIDTTDWIEKGDEETAISNPYNWVYSVDNSINTTLAMEYEGELYFFFESVNDSQWNSAQLFYHNDSLRAGNGYNIEISISSSHAGNITINGNVYQLEEGINDLEISCVYEEGTTAVSIQFGTEADGILADNLEIIVNSFKITKKANARDIIESALDAKNYTITLTEGMNGYTVTSKYFENAAYFAWENTIDITSGSYGNAENDEGVFGFSIYNNQVIPNNNYYTRDDEVVKGLYTTDYTFMNDHEGLPSLYQLDLSNFDYNLETGKKVRISDGSTLKTFTFMLDEFYSTYYYSGVAATDITLKEDGSLEFAIRTRMGDTSRFTLSNIGTTTDEAIESFVTSDKFGPSNDVVSVGDPEVVEMLSDIQNGNYSINKPNGQFYMNEKYSYDISLDPETNEEVISGYIKLEDGVYGYSVEGEEVILGTNYTELYESITEVKHLAGLLSGQVTYFNDASKYMKNESEGWYEMVPSGSGYYSFSTKWFGRQALSCDLITLERGVSNINIGASMAFTDGSGNVQAAEMVYLVVYQIGNSTCDFMENYLNSNTL